MIIGSYKIDDNDHKQYDPILPTINMHEYLTRDLKFLNSFILFDHLFLFANHCGEEYYDDGENIRS